MTQAETFCEIFGEYVTEDGEKLWRWAESPGYTICDVENYGGMVLAMLAHDDTASSSRTITNNVLIYRQVGVEPTIIGDRRLIVFIDGSFIEDDQCAIRREPPIRLSPLIGSTIHTWLTDSNDAVNDYHSYK